MKLAKKSDIKIIAVIALIAAGLAVWFLIKNAGAEKGKYAEIYYKSRLVERIDLAAAAEGEFSVDEVPDVVFRIYEDGSIAFIRSDCPDKICINSGKLSKNGHFAACLPNEVYVKIVSEDKPGADLIIG